ncbi:MAG: hypothetical protein ACRDSK_29775 [Actinophytocola sp.]|uniref:hypothetical protein n=1 Tax=Actinophytocola sp. TaxID=1872138 RepID=UPI003D6AA9BB
MHTAAAGQVTRHADNIEAVRARFAAVHDASAAISRDEDTYGLLCRWITDNFRSKHVRQDELVAYVEENLRRIGESLRDAAEAPAPPLDPVRLAARPILTAPVDVPAVVRFGWALVDAEPLRDVLDELTGKPLVIAAHAETWQNIAVELWAMAEELEDIVEYDIPDWHGDAAEDHRRLMGHNVEAVKGLSSVSAALAEITESVGILVAQTRRIVRDLVIDLMALTAPLPVPTAPTEGTFARWACRIAVYAVALDTTLTHLENRLNG